MKVRNAKKEQEIKKKKKTGKHFSFQNSDSWPELHIITYEELQQILVAESYPMDSDLIDPDVPWKFAFFKSPQRILTCSQG